MVSTVTAPVPVIQTSSVADSPESVWTATNTAKTVSAVKTVKKNGGLKNALKNGGHEI